MAPNDHNFLLRLISTQFMVSLRDCFFFFFSFRFFRKSFLQFNEALFKRHTHCLFVVTQFWLILISRSERVWLRPFPFSFAKIYPQTFLWSILEKVDRLIRCNVSVSVSVSRIYNWWWWWWWWLSRLTSAFADNPLHCGNLHFSFLLFLFFVYFPFTSFLPFFSFFIYSIPFLFFTLFLFSFTFFFLSFISFFSIIFLFSYIYNYLAFPFSLCFPFSSMILSAIYYFTPEIYYFFSIPFYLSFRICYYFYYYFISSTFSA